MSQSLADRMASLANELEGVGNDDPKCAGLITAALMIREQLIRHKLSERAAEKAKEAGDRTVPPNSFTLKPMTITVQADPVDPTLRRWITRIAKP